MTANAFIRTTDKSNHWLNELMKELKWTDHDRAYHALRAVLHELRDQLPLNEAVHLASQLPMLIRGSYYENWVPKELPQHSDVESFVSRVGWEFVKDLTVDPEQVTKAVFGVLSSHISAGEIKDVIACLPDEFRVLWPAQKSVSS